MHTIINAILAMTMATHAGSLVCTASAQRMVQHVLYVQYSTPLLYTVYSSSTNIVLFCCCCILYSVCREFYTTEYYVLYHTLYDAYYHNDKVFADYFFITNRVVVI